MSWRTTLFGLMASIGAAVMSALTTNVIDPATLPAWVKSVFALISVIGTAGMGFVARDNSVTSEEVSKRRKSTVKAYGNTVGLFLCLCLIVATMSGCASYSSSQTAADGRETRVRAFSFWDSSNMIARIKTTNTDKTQSTGIDGLDQASTSTNLTAQAAHVVKGLELIGKLVP